MDDFAHKDDCTILRGDEAKAALHSETNDNAVLVDEEGDIIFQFPNDWTDKQIWHALLFVNAKHHRGIERGFFLAQQKIKRALGIETNG